MNNEEHYYNKMSEIISYLESTVKQQPSLFEIANKANLSPYHFQRSFKKWVGVSPKQFLQVLSIERLKERLKSASSINLAADDVGYSSSSRVHDLFVNFDGITPGEYKSYGQNLTIEYGMSNTPFGPAFIAVTKRGINRISFIEVDQFDAELASLRSEWPNADIFKNNELATEYLSKVFGENRSPVQILAKGTPFQLKNWQALLNIPDGALTTYQQIAAAIGQPQASRAVGNAIGKNPIAYLIPCHRVIRTNGGLGGYKWGITRKKILMVVESQYE
jgi:AraC family transcriptional regulator of adaptative response/methylated-DNA-[protein]-cysteine methyltransferase